MFNTVNICMTRTAFFALVTASPRVAVESRRRARVSAKNANETATVVSLAIPSPRATHERTTDAYARVPSLPLFLSRTKSAEDAARHPRLAAASVHAVACVKTKIRLPRSGCHARHPADRQRNPPTPQCVTHVIANTPSAATDGVVTTDIPKIVGESPTPVAFESVHERARASIASERRERDARDRSRSRARARDGRPRTASSVAH